MQTFLPERDFTLSAQRLDYRRLGKQRVECKQIYLALTIPSYGWKHHPAVKMWAGYEDALLYYAYEMCREWRRRGYNDSLMDWFADRIGGKPTFPAWLDDSRVIRSHRGSLLQKDPAHYGQFPWRDATFAGYHWPI